MFHHHCGVDDAVIPDLFVAVEFYVYDSSLELDDSFFSAGYGGGGVGS